MFVIGELSTIFEDEKPVPGVAPAEMQACGYVAEVVCLRIEHLKVEPSCFRYVDACFMAPLDCSIAAVS